MLALSLLSMAAMAFAATTTTNSVCGAAAYSSLLPLSADAAAKSYCSSVLPSLHPTSTLIVVSTSVVATSSMPGTLTDVIITQSTATVSPGAELTAFTDVWVTDVAEATVTIYASTATSSECPYASAESALSALSANELSTACSCIGALPTSYSASDMSYVTITKITTVTQTSAAATTFVTGYVVLTAEAATTESFTFTSSVVSTQTVYAASPSYTQVFGPKAGCADTAITSVQQLDSTTTEQDDAVAQCQELCTADSACASVFVQHMDTDEAPQEPIWECYFNNGAFNATSDSQCGRKTGIWGTAVAFNAVGRG